MEFFCTIVGYNYMASSKDYWARRDEEHQTPDSGERLSAFYVITSMMMIFFSRTYWSKARRHLSWSLMMITCLLTWNLSFCFKEAWQVLNFVHWNVRNYLTMNIGGTTLSSPHAGASLAMMGQYWSCEDVKPIQHRLLMARRGACFVLRPHYGQEIGSFGN